jgi:hypothetical protein
VRIGFETDRLVGQDACIYDGVVNVHQHLCDRPVHQGSFRNSGSTDKVLPQFSGRVEASPTSEQAETPWVVASTF